MVAVSKRVLFVHTVGSLVPVFGQLAAEVLGSQVEVWHIADEMLLRVVLAAGGLTPFIYRRVADHVVAAEQAGVDVVQLTCSSISPCADVAQPLVGIPVLKVDEPMVDRAIALGRRIGVLATVRTTLAPTIDLIQRRAKAMGKEVSVAPRLCEEAYAALFAGDTATHDRLVGAALRELMTESEVVLLAQASMARALDAVPEVERPVPVLTSPRLAVERLRDVLSARSA